MDKILALAFLGTFALAGLGSCGGDEREGDNSQKV